MIVHDFVGVLDADDFDGDCSALTAAGPPSHSGWSRSILASLNPGVEAGEIMILLQIWHTTCLLLLM